MFQVLVTLRGTDDWTPCNGGQQFDTGADAAAFVTEMRDQHGTTHSYKIKPMDAAPDATDDVIDDAWKQREQDHFNYGRYIFVPWHNAEWNDTLRYEHYAHISLKEPGKIAFTEDAAKGRADRQTTIAPGRYLTRYFANDLSATEIESFAAQVSVTAGEFELHITQDADEIEQVYLGGPSSCMSHDLSDYSGDQHPVRAYAGPDTAIAWIGSDIDSAQGRAVVWPEKKLYSVPYGDTSRMRMLLKDAGYEAGSLVGARMQRIEDGYAHGRLIVPYVDGIGYAGDDGQYLTLGVGNGNDVYMQRTDGVSEDEDERPTCDRCEESYDEDDAHIVNEDESWCRFCAHNYATTCEHNNERYSDDAHTFATVYSRDYFGAIFTETVLDDNLDDHGARYHEASGEHGSDELVTMAEAIESLAVDIAVAIENDPRTALVRGVKALADTLYLPGWSEVTCAMLRVRFDIETAELAAFDAQPERQSFAAYPAMDDTYLEGQAVDLDALEALLAELTAQDNAHSMALAA